MNLLFTITVTALHALLPNGSTKGEVSAPTHKIIKSDYSIRLLSSFTKQTWE